MKLILTQEEYKRWQVDSSYRRSVINTAHEHLKNGATKVDIYTPNKKEPLMELNLRSQELH